MNYSELKQIFRELKSTSPREDVTTQISEYLCQIIEHRTPCGLFLTKERRTWVAVDNTTGDAWTEEFSRKRQAMRWLRGKFEVN